MIEPGQQSTAVNPQAVNLDFKRVFARAISYWYVVVGALAIALGTAVYQNRYSQKLYPINASILIREVEEGNGAELLFKNSVLSGYRNYLNEPYVLRSFPVIEKVVRDLHFDVSFFREGYVITS
ncbi:MAG: hypothetical protein ACK5VK_14500, partial [Cyclobacteriaceae bacterium]